MSRRLVIIAETLPAEKRDAVTEKIKAAAADFWHWFPDAWLIADAQNREPKWWGDYIHDVLTTEAFLLLEAPPGGVHYGYMRPDQWKWFNEGHWT
jgi:hypothetical protein